MPDRHMEDRLAKGQKWVDENLALAEQGDATAIRNLREWIKNIGRHSKAETLIGLIKHLRTLGE